MRRRAPITLWLHIAGDVWKLVLLTTVVLATVIAFALMIKPLADGKLGPQTAVKFMFIAFVPALQYVLPFAACFGSTLAYHRLAADNELTACHAGGISHRSLLIPAAVSGALLAIILLALSSFAIPRYFRSMAELISQNASQLIISSIERGDAISLPNDPGTILFADKVISQGPDPESNAYERLYLQGLMVIRLDKEGNVKAQGSAREAAVWLRRVAGDADSKPSTQVILKPKEFVGTLPGSRTAGQDAITTFTIPNAFADNVKFFNAVELQEVREKPERIDSVDKPRRALAVKLSELEMVDAVREALRTTGKADFIDPFGARVVLRAASLRATATDGRRNANVWRIEAPSRGSPIIVEKLLTDGKIQRQSAASAYLRLPTTVDPQRPATSATIQLLDVSAENLPAGTDLDDAPVDAPDLDSPLRAEAKERPVADVRFTTDTLTPLLNKPGAELIDLANKRISVRKADADVVGPAAHQLQNETGDVLREILSKEHERYAGAVACLVMIVLGSLMAMRLRDAMPLSVYLWAFFPALATMIAISGGQQLTHGQGALGLPVLWSGVVALSIFGVLEFIKLRKH
jgi:lipopolysaccharide export LptBFGC system permease protein LptF